jgi:hypothetical protein
MESRSLNLGDLKIEIMTQQLEFESRIGRLSCNAGEFYNFATDIRNFEQFIPEGNINNLQIMNDSCSFQVPPLGSVNVRITGKEPYSRVVFSGDALQKSEFILTLDITENEQKVAFVGLSIKADLNPLLRMMAAKPIEQFLEKLITEMERFRNWGETVK